MIHGRVCKWLKQPFPHYTMRFDAVARKANSGAFKFEEYLASQDMLFRELQKLRKESFEDDYRRRSKNFTLEIDESKLVDAYAKPKFPDTGFISRGLIFSIEDAAQSIVSDIRSSFALNSEDRLKQDLGQAPDVVWNIRSAKILDPNRFVDYSIIAILAEECDEMPLGLLHKFVSISPFRQKLGDLISSLSLLWISAHEDAHFYLGHIEYFNHPFGALDRNDDFFQEMVRNYKTKELKDLRTSSEISADENAAYALVDHFCFDEMFSINHFLYKHFLYTQPDVMNNDEQFKKAKIIYLFRLCVVSITIALAVFERNTIKNSALSGYYPDISTRILGIIVAVSGRIQIVSKLHPERQLYKLSHQEWDEAFFYAKKDITIILRYLFDVNFVLNDNEIMVKSAKEVMAFDFTNENFNTLLLYLSMSATIDDSIPSLDELRREKVVMAMKDEFTKGDWPVDSDMIKFLSEQSKMSTLGAHKFKEARLKVNPERTHKVVESIEQELRMAEKFRMVTEALKGLPR